MRYDTSMICVSTRIGLSVHTQRVLQPPTVAMTLRPPELVLPAVLRVRRKGHWSTFRRPQRKFQAWDFEAMRNAQPGETRV